MTNEPDGRPGKRAPPEPAQTERPESVRSCGPGLPHKWRSIWISDVHLGTRGCKSDRLLRFLQDYDSEYLYLVGDIVDGWSIRRSWYWNEEHNRILQTILKKSSRGARVSYVTGNHDEFLRDYAGIMFGGIALKHEATHETADGRRLLIVHGDRFDLCVRNARWLGLLGERAYQACRLLDGPLKWLRRRLGLGQWSLSAYLKRRVKQAVSYAEVFEQAAREEASRRGFDGVVCGHIHQAALRTVNGILYCNDGDWVESCTALVEDQQGRLSLLSFTPEPERALAGSQA